jgi:sporulation protein YlmC with PRC-barrel domain
MENKMTRLAINVLTAGVLAAASIAAIPAFAADNMQTAEELRTSKLVGSKVYNNANENIGSIDDIILKPDGSMDEVVLSVGGFLGMGDKYVAVPFSNLKITQDGNGFKVVTDGTKDSLKALPAYQFFKS